VERAIFGPGGTILTLARSAADPVAERMMIRRLTTLSLIGVAAAFALGA
jgi:hypothetical protein